MHDLRPRIESQPFAVPLDLFDFCSNLLVFWVFWALISSFLFLVSCHERYCYDRFVC
jgi:hypothetical protein